MSLESVIHTMRNGGNIGIGGNVEEADTASRGDAGGQVLSFATFPVFARYRERVFADDALALCKRGFICPST